MDDRWKNTIYGYGWISISLHWLMLFLIVAAYTTMDLKSAFPRNTPARVTVLYLHYIFGLFTFILVWVRIWARFVSTLPFIKPAMPFWQEKSAKSLHWMLYGLMIILPLSGWLLINAKGITIPVFNEALPAQIGKNKEMSKWLRGVHNTVATTGYFLVGLHAAATLFHHYISRDNTLKLMLPRQ